MKVFPGDALAFNLGHSYSALQSLTAIFSASHFTSSAPLSSLARISVLFISGWGFCFLLPMGRYITPPLPSHHLCWVRNFTHVCSTWLAGMKGDSPSPSWGQDELHPAERGNGDEVGKRSGSFAYFPHFHCPLSIRSSPPLFLLLLLRQTLTFPLCPTSLHLLPFLPPPPPFFSHFAMIDDHDVLVLDSLLTSWRGSGQWAASPPPLFCFILCFYFHHHCPHSPPTSFFSLSVTCLSSHLLFNTITRSVSLIEKHVLFCCILYSCFSLGAVTTWWRPPRVFSSCPADGISRNSHYIILLVLFASALCLEVVK